MSEIKKHARKWMYWFLLGVAIIVVYKALDNFGNVTDAIGKFFNVISPFFIGIFIAYILYVPCEKIEQTYKKSKIKIIKKAARGLSIFTVYIIALLLIIILFNVILPVVVQSVMDLLNNIQWYFESAINRYNSLPDDSILKAEVVQDEINSIKNINIKQYFQLEKILEYAVEALNAVTSIFKVFVALIVSIYILIERTTIIKFLKNFINAMFTDKTYKNIDKYFNNSNEIFFKFVASQFLDAIVMGILATIALMIMKVKYAPLLGFIIGLFNMIPYIGAIIAVAISTLITLITGGISQAIWMVIIITILQQIDANIINPKIVGQSLKISPLLVIFAVIIGGEYFGMLGMFLAVPVIAVIKILVEDYINLRLEEKNKVQNE